MTKRMQGWTVRGAAAGLMLLVAGCSGDNSGNPTGYEPEGTKGQAILLAEVLPFDADTTQVFVQMIVVSPPPADGFRFYVNPNNEGYRPATEAAIPPSTTFDSGWSFYQSALDGYDPTTTALVLLGRGARRGVESVYSQVTSTGVVPAAPAHYLARREPVVLTAPRDSAVVTSLAPGVFTWLPLPNAQSYVLQAFNASTGEPGMVVYINDATTTRVELEMSMLNQVPYRWNVHAYDAWGRAIGVSPQRLVSYLAPD